MLKSGMLPDPIQRNIREIAETEKQIRRFEGRMLTHEQLTEFYSMDVCYLLSIINAMDACLLKFTDVNDVNQFLLSIKEGRDILPYELTMEDLAEYYKNRVVN